MPPTPTITVNASGSFAEGATAIFAGTKAIGITEAIKLDEHIPVPAPLSLPFALPSFAPVEYLFIKNDGPDDIDFTSDPPGPPGPVVLKAGDFIELTGQAARDYLTRLAGAPAMGGFIVTATGPVSTEGRFKAYAGLLV
jgi:hypothetical protein